MKRSLSRNLERHTRHSSSFKKRAMNFRTRGHVKSQAPGLKLRSCNRNLYFVTNTVDVPYFRFIIKLGEHIINLSTALCGKYSTVTTLEALPRLPSSSTALLRHSHAPDSWPRLDPSIVRVVPCCRESTLAPYTHV